MSRALAALGLALLVGACAVQAHDIYTSFKVLDCKGQPVVGAEVEISGCVDNPLTASTGSDGIAYFAPTSMGGTKDWNWIVYCYGISTSTCKFRVKSTPDPILAYDELIGLPTYPTPREYACKTLQDCSCTGDSTNGYGCGTCNSPVTVPIITFVAKNNRCVTPPTTYPAPYGETCFAWFGPTYQGGVLTGLVTSLSLRANQKSDSINGNVLTSGAYSLNQSPPVPPFVQLDKVNRWGWQQLYNLPASGSSVVTGIMYCGQNRPSGTISVTVSNTSFEYTLTMTGVAVPTGAVHVFASCQAWSDKSVAPGQFNCNPGKAGCAQTVTATGLSANQYKAVIDITSLPGCTAAGAQLFSMIHLGL